MIALALLLLSAGCSLTDSSGTRHTLVLGIGILSVHQTNSILVYKTQVLGLGAGNLPGLSLAAGYGENIGVTAATNTLVEISKKPCSPLIIAQP